MTDNDERTEDGGETGETTTDEVRAALERFTLQRATVAAVVDRLMVEGYHYGQFPGRRSRGLLGPGAELLASVLGLSPMLRDETIDEGGGHRTYRATVRLIERRTGEVVSEGIGSASTLEPSKRYDRQQQERPDPAAEWHNVERIATKRAFVHAVLIGTAARDFFDPPGKETTADRTSAARKAGIRVRAQQAARTASSGPRDPDDEGDGGDERGPEAGRTEPEGAPGARRGEQLQPDGDHGDGCTADGKTAEREIADSEGTSARIYTPEDLEEQRARLVAAVIARSPGRYGGLDDPWPTIEADLRDRGYDPDDANAVATAALGAEMTVEARRRGDPEPGGEYAGWKRFDRLIRAAASSMGISTRNATRVVARAMNRAGVRLEALEGPEGDDAEARIAAEIDREETDE